jgi:chromosome segregation ATPase
VSWTAEEESRLMELRPAGMSPEEVLSIATRAVELVRARGGTMTEERLGLALRILEQGGPAESRARNTEMVAQHIAAQGARVAALEPEGARLKPSGQVAEDVESIEATIRQWTTYDDGSREWDLIALARLAASAQAREEAEERAALHLRNAQRADKEAEALRAKVAKLEAVLAEERIQHKAFQDAVEASAARLEEKVTNIEQQSHEAIAQRDAARAEVERLKTEPPAEAKE